MSNTRNIEFVEGVFESTHYAKQSSYPYVAFSEEEDKFLYSNRGYVVTFKNYNDDVLYQTTVNAGENVVYGGIIPQRTGFLFSGWDKNTSHKIYRDTVFNAVFEEQIIEVPEEPVLPDEPLPTYEIQFLFDGSIIKREYVTEGSMPTPPDAITGSMVNIIILTWDKEIVPATENAIYNVQTFKEEYRTYTVTFMKPDGGEMLKQYDSVTAGTLLSSLPEFNNPSSLNEEHYNCIGWMNANGRIVNNMAITSNVTLIAVYEPKKYTIEFWIFGEYLISSQEVEYNTMPSAPLVYYRAADNCSFEILSWNDMLITGTDTDPVIPAVANARYSSAEVKEYSGSIH